MKHRPIIDIIIPAFNEEKAIGNVLDDIPAHLVREVIVCNNNSTDRTAEVARAHGATVVHQPLRGYGNACLKGLEHIAAKDTPPDIVVFLDGDHSDHPGQLAELIAPISDDGVDLVIGSRVLGRADKGSLTPQQRFGNWLATLLIRILYGVRYTDLGPFRAIQYDSLLALHMADRNYGWTVEMQVKAAKLGLTSVEVPVNYRVRIGQSKVSGTLRGTVGAGYKILLTVFRHV
ncbi:MAG: glycosyltransferase family 2 protein [Flavobacteriales bacterium]|nr:glycosyltransferase family 2 protein [Flavobacteriales bacterium]